MDRTVSVRDILSAGHEIGVRMDGKSIKEIRSFADRFYDNHGLHIRYVRVDGEESHDGPVGDIDGFVLVASGLNEISGPRSRASIQRLAELTQEKFRKNLIPTKGLITRHWAGDGAVLFLDYLVKKQFKVVNMSNCLEK